MNLILVADIFGKTPVLIELAKEINAKIIVDPYDGKFMAFDNESDAYCYFIENIGLEAYSEALLNKVKSIDCECSLIGFSVGASAIWQISDKITSYLVQQAICYYGSQIRYLLATVPKIEVQIVLPRSEPHFSISGLETRLSEFNNVKVRRVDYLHGFMNAYSNNYNQIGYKEQIDLLRKK